MLIALSDLVPCKCGLYLLPYQ